MSQVLGLWLRFDQNNRIASGERIDASSNVVLAVLASGAGLLAPVLFLAVIAIALSESNKLPGSDVETFR